MQNRNVFRLGAARRRSPGWLLLFGTVIIGLAACGSANAQIVNGGFETGTFSGYSTDGLTSIKTSSFGITPPEGTHDALLQTGAGDASAASLDTFLNLPAGTLEGIGYTDGSAISQTFTGNLNDVLTFKYDFLTNESSTNPSAGDAGFAFLGFINSVPFESIGLGTPAEALTAAPGATGYATQTGILSGIPTDLTSSGTFTLSFVVLTMGDPAGSALLVDDIALNGLTNPAAPVGGGGGAVPLPAAVWTGALAALLAAGCVRGLRRTARS